MINTNTTVHEDGSEEALEDFSIWSACCTLADAVVSEVRSTGNSKTLERLYEEIKSRYQTGCTQ